MTSRLTIGIDARAATEVPGGRGRVVRELLRALVRRPEAHRYVCYGRTVWPEPLDDRFEWELVAAPDPLWHLRVARQADRQCDAFLATNSYLSVALTRKPSVSIVHDLLSFKRTTATNRRSMAIEWCTLGPAVRRARELICVSAATRSDLIARYPSAAARSSVALLGVAPVLSAHDPAELAELPGPGFTLAVGTLEPRKNLPRLIEAYRLLPEAVRRRHPLVVVGALGWSVGPTLAAVASLGPDCVRLGHVSDATLAELYRRCAVFCYPSLGEGFGLPVLEAMAAGAAVVTSNVSSLPEVGGDSVLYVDPHQPADIARTLGRLLDDRVMREDLSQRARDRASRFSWDSFTGRVLAALERAATAQPAATSGGGATAASGR